MCEREGGCEEQGHWQYGRRVRADVIGVVRTLVCVAVAGWVAVVGVGV